LEQDGRRVRSLSFPEYETPIGREIRHALDGARDFSADVMQLLYVANRLEFKARLELWLGAGDIVVCDRYCASTIAYGEAQGLDSGWLNEIQRYLPKADITVLLDIAPDTAVRRKATNRDRYERDLGLLARVATATNVRRPRPAGALSTRRRRKRRWRRRWNRPSCHGSRRRQHAHTPDAVRQQNRTARIDRRPCRHDIVDEHHSAREQRPAHDRRRYRPGRAHAERPIEIAKPHRGGQTGLRWTVPPAPQDAPDRRTQLARQIVGLIESALERADRMQRHGNDGVGVSSSSAPVSRIIRPSGSASTRALAVLECVDDVFQRTVIASGAACHVKLRRVVPAAGALAVRLGPSIELVTATRAPWCTDPRDQTPAGTAHGAREWCLSSAPHAAQAGASRSRTM
jgi:hypothetical protein